MDRPKPKETTNYKARVLEELKKRNTYGRPLNYFVLVVNLKIQFLYFLVTLFIYFRKHNPESYMFFVPLIAFLIIGRSAINEILIIFDLHWEYTPFSKIYLSNIE